MWRMELVRVFFPPETFEFHFCTVFVCYLLLTRTHCVAHRLDAGADAALFQF